MCEKNDNQAVNLGWEQLLGEPVGSNTICGVKLSNAQFEGLTAELSM